MGPVPSGEELIRELGCGACHAGLPVRARAAAPALDDVGERYTPGQLFAYLQNPQPTRSGSARARMPDFHLDERESLALTLYLTDGRGRRAGRGEGDAERAFEQAQRQHRESDAELGRAIFRSQNCAGCHIRSGEDAWAAGPLLSGEGSRAEPEWLREFLRNPTPVRPFGFQPGTGSRMPDFRLSAEEVDTLGAYLMRQTQPLAAGTQPPRELSPFARAKAEALLREQLPCLGCHAIDGEGGRIGPDLARVRERRQPAYIEAMLRDPQATSPGTVMPPTPMPPETFELILGYLLGREGATEPERLSLVENRIHFPQGRSDEELLYGRVCAACHGPQGGGDGYNARFLPTPPTVHASAEYISLRPDDTMYDGIHSGGRILNRSPRMPAFGAMLGREQIRGLVRHIRELCRCDGPRWARDGREARR
jgi:mono/diheme cytochrome c family protein